MNIPYYININDNNNHIYHGQYPNLNGQNIILNNNHNHNNNNHNNNININDNHKENNFINSPNTFPEYNKNINPNHDLKANIPFDKWTSDNVSNWFNNMKNEKIGKKSMFRRMKKELSNKTGNELLEYTRIKLFKKYGECGILLYKEIKKISQK